MSEEVKTAQGSAATVESRKFKDMSFTEKLAYIGKAAVFVATFGFAFPNIFVD